MRKQSHNRLDSSRALIAAVFTSLMAVMVSADSLEGIGLRGFSDWRGRDRLSMMGGAKLTTKETGAQLLNEEAGSNYLEF